MINGEGWRGNTHWLLSTVVASLVASGHDLIAIYDIANDRTTPFGRVMRETYGADLVDVIRRQWAHADQARREHAKTCDAWADHVVACWPIRGRSGGTLRVAIGLAELARTAGRLSFDTSLRRIARVAGVGWAADGAARVDTACVTRALAKLEGHGLIAVTASNRTTDIAQARTRITLCSPDLWTPTLSSRTDGASGHRNECDEQRTYAVVSSRLILHGIWDETALGATAGRCWLTLRNLRESIPSAAVAQRLGVSSNSARMLLGKLEAAGLAVRSVGGWQCVKRSLDSVATDLGIIDRRAQRDVAYQRELAQWQGDLASRRQQWADASFDAGGDPFGDDPPEAPYGVLRACDAVDAADIHPDESKGWEAHTGGDAWGRGVAA